MTNPVRATVLLVILAAPAGATLTPYVEVGRDPNQTQAIVMPTPIDLANVPAGAKGVPTESTQTLGAGSTLFRIDDVESDVVHFGGGLLGPKLHLPPLPLSTPVGAQLRRIDDGGCWNATYGHPSKNQGTVLKAVSD